MKKLVLLFFALFLIWSSGIQAQVAINTDGSAADASAMLEVKSSNKGLLIPRLTTMQRNTLATIAVAGLMVYDTNLSRFFFFNGTTWEDGSVGNLWTRSGSNTYLTNSSDKVGIGTTTPTRNIDIWGPWQTARISSTSSGATLEFVSTAADDWSIGVWAGSMIFLNSTDDFANKTDEYYLTTSSFYPWTSNTKTLGTTSKQWSNLYSVAGNFTGAVATGALTTTGNATFSGSIGIGTTSPAQKIDIHIAAGPAFERIKSDDAYAGIMIEKGSASQNGYILYRTGSTNYWSVGMIGNNDFNISTTYSSSGSKFYINSSGQVGIGTTSPATGYRLSVDGKIICEELRVDLSTGWPDYVFGKEYKLMSLKELDSFIQTNGHLPNIPAAAEIQESGLEVGEMQRLMMEKIEELSLYIIEQQKEIDELKSLINKNQE